MIVTVRDRAKEAAAWGSPGRQGPALVTVEIADSCPECGGARGEPSYQPFHEDGETFLVSVWANPCGHLDLYSAVLTEATGAGQ